MPELSPIPFTEAFERLRAGNARFVQDVRSVQSLATQSQREALLEGQAPYAVVLSCSDSRVPTELVFDCGLGDVFPIRIAGNIVAPSIIGSVEYAAAYLGTQLVVVMSHTRCGAITATVDALRNGREAPSASVKDIVDRIAPGIAEIVACDACDDEVISHATRANARASANQLRHGSRILERLIGEGRMAVISAEYSLETGAVDFFDLPRSLRGL